MGTIRIYKIAEVLGIPSQEVVQLLRTQHGIEAKSASSTVEEIVARQFAERIARKRNVTLPSGSLFSQRAASKRGGRGGNAPEAAAPEAPRLGPPRLVKSAKAAKAAAEATANDTADPGSAGPENLPAGTAPPTPAPDQRAGAHGAVGIGDRLVGDTGKPAQDLDLFGRLDLAHAIEQILRGDETHARQSFLQTRYVTGRQMIELDADGSASEAEIAEEIGEHVHGVVGELTPDADVAVGQARADRSLFHVDAEHRNSPVARDHRHRVSPAHQRMRGYDEAGEIGVILGGGGEQSIEPRLVHGLDLSVDNRRSHRISSADEPPLVSGFLPLSSTRAVLRARSTPRSGSARLSLRRHLSPCRVLPVR